MRVALGRPFHDATSGSYAANARRCCSRSDESGAPEVEALPPGPGRAARGGGAGRHARPCQRRVEAAGQEGARSRVDGDRDAVRRAPLVASTWLGSSPSRLLDAARRAPPVCAARLRAAGGGRGGADAVVLSGWARSPPPPSEAELMTAAWHGPDVPLVPDGDARTTAGNARVARLARSRGRRRSSRSPRPAHFGGGARSSARFARRRARLVAPAGRTGSACAPASSPALASPLQSALLRRPLATPPAKMRP